MDVIVATGEIVASRVMATALDAESLLAVWIDARRVLVTDEEHGAAQPDIAATESPAPWCTWIVGLVPDVPSEGLAVEPVPVVYVPMRGTSGGVFPSASIAVRTKGDPTMAAGMLRDSLASLDPELALSNVQTMRQIESA